jgi:N-acetylglucosamine repressor
MNKTSPIQSKLLSKINERLVLRMIQDCGPSTRAEMSKMIGITFPTVAKAVTSLLDSKLLEEIDEVSTGPGRPAKLLRLASENSQVIGVTLSSSECMVASAGLNGVIYPESSQSFISPSTYDAVLIETTRRVKKLMLASGRSTLIVGVSVPSVVDYQEQRAIFSANMPMLNGKCLGSDLQGLLGVECLIVRDTHALSLSERLQEKEEEEVAANFAMLDLCGGIGLGLMVDGNFLTGNSGFAGELGHIPIVPEGDICRCGKKGCLETVASEWALEAKVSLALRRTVKMHEILEMARAGHRQVLAELENMCHYLAIGVAHVVNIINPGTFYIFGRVFQACPHLLDFLVENTKQYALEPSFTSCRFTQARGGVMDGTIASIINYLTDSRVPDLDGYVRFAGVPINRSLVAP